MKVVDVMNQQPGCCIACGQSPVSLTEEGHVPLPALDLEIDVNWGDNAYLCHSCVNIGADLFDRVSLAEHNDLQLQFEELQAKHEKLKKFYARLKNRMDAMVAGKRAVKDHKEELAA